MNGLDRTIAPGAHPIRSIEILEPEHFLLPNNLPVYTLSADGHEVVKVELLFNAGAAHHDNPLVPSFTSAMLQEGTRNRTAAEIAAAIDDYGAFLEFDHDKDFSSVTLYTLNHYLPETLPVIRELVTESVFPEREGEILRSNRLDNFRINLNKVNFVAGKRFQELIFRGSQYGIPFGEDEYHSITVDQLVAFWQKHFKLSNALILLSGNVTDAVKKVVTDVLGSTVPLNHAFDQELPADQPAELIEREQFILRKDALQSAIRIGRRLFTKNHPDYFGMKVLSTVLGGYFGSRLMTNIREDKGYTYGIGAGTAAYRNDGYFYITTEVGADVCRPALNEIYREIDILQQEPVSDKDLNLVKNYMLGNLLKSFDGPFERMERFKGVHLYGTGQHFYHGYVAAIRSATAESLLKLARTWLQKDDLVELVVGKK